MLSTVVHPLVATHRLYLLLQLCRNVHKISTRCCPLLVNLVVRHAMCACIPDADQERPQSCSVVMRLCLHLQSSTDFFQLIFGVSLRTEDAACDSLGVGPGLVNHTLSLTLL